MSFIMVDVETDGEIPGDFSMIELGAVVVRRGENWKDTSGLKDTFHGKLHPVSDRWNDDALKVSNHTREETLLFDDPIKVIEQNDGLCMDVKAERRKLAKTLAKALRS